LRPVEKIVFFDGDEILEIGAAVVAVFVQAATTTITTAIGITPCGVLIWQW
jgi:hypothetical protein